MRKLIPYSASGVVGCLLLAAGLAAPAGAGEPEDSPVLLLEAGPELGGATPEDAPRPVAQEGPGVRTARAQDTPLPVPRLEPEAKAARPEAAAKPAPAAPAAALSPAMLELRQRVRRVSDLYYRLAPNTRDNTPTEIMNFCLAFGCDAEVGYPGPPAAKISGIGCLCWNMPCAGYTLLEVDGSGVLARLGYGLQAHPSQLLALLAQARVPADYEIRVGPHRRTVADLVESEKRTCRPGADLSSKLLGLSHYVADGASWQDNLGQTWSVERLVEHELDRSVSRADRDVTNRLMGISYAVYRRAARRAPLDGPYARAKKHLAECHDYALQLQNADGSWHPGFLAYKGTSTDVPGTICSTGHILEWLVFSLPEERLEEPRVVRSVDYLAAVLERRQGGMSLASLPPRQVEGILRAVHALRIFDGRVFVPREAEKPADATAE
jgi:hypothetical protein